MWFQKEQTNLEKFKESGVFATNNPGLFSELVMELKRNNIKFKADLTSDFKYCISSIGV